LFPKYGQYSEKAVNPGGKSLKDVLGVDKSDIAFIQKYNLSSKELRLYKGLKKMGQVMTKEILTWTRSSFKDTYYFEYSRILGLADYASINKVIKYIDQQRGTDRRVENVIRDWEDYIENARKLEYDLKLDMVLFPKDLNEAHDRVANIIKTKANEQYNNTICMMEKELNSKFNYENNQFIIRAPHDVAEIVEEGSKLNHCVGTYIERIAKGTTSVLFIRDKNNPDKPFYTMEVQNLKVIQCRGLRNCDMTPEVKAFVEKWKARILEKQIKLSVNKPA
jgi:hypothetical protein